jgi:hypothetical protein
MRLRLGRFRRAAPAPVIPALTRLGCGLLRPHEPHLFETSVQRFSCPGIGEARVVAEHRVVDEAAG